MAVFSHTKSVSTKCFLAASLSIVVISSGLGAGINGAGAASASSGAKKQTTNIAYAGASKNKAAVSEYQRLPEFAVPERYDLYFEPNFEAGDFEGTETVYLKLSESTKEITLNSLDLSVFEASISRSEKTHGDWIKAEIERNKEQERVVFKFDKALAPGRYELSVKFSGKFSDKLCGFYLSSFKDKDGKEQKMASTQMEPTDARRMFPCFDEPVYKATYRVTAAIPRDMVAISNAAVQFEKVDQRKDKKVVTFEESPRMSSYLFALVIGHLKSSQPVTVNGKEIRVWCTEGKENLTSFALSSAAKFLAFYENYFGVPYPLKKLDLIGVPDFAHGAMENIGAITFRETALLVDEQNGSTHSKMRVADVVAHEMAHLWFGDLVTMAWWNDLWLNEAFATWMSVKAVDNLKPEWRLWDQLATERAGDLTSDSIAATRAVQCVVNSPNDALEMFDEITYGKGAALLRMLEMYLSPDTFQAGIQGYMKKHAFGNATTEDLWLALSHAANSEESKNDSSKNHKNKDGVDVSALMQAWVHSPGCPLVSFNVEEKKDKKGSDAAVTFEQERFMLLQPSAKKNSGKEKPQVWEIPLVLKSATGHERYLLTDASAKATFNNFDPVFLNGLGNGFFRTRYNAAQLGQLKSQLKKNPQFLNPAEKVSLVADLWNLAYAGRISIDEYLAFTDSFCAEKDPYVQQVLVSHLEELDGLISDDMRPGYQALVRKRLTPMLDQLTLNKRDGDSDLVNLLRGEIVKTLATVGADSKTIEYFQSKFETYLNDEKSLESNMLAPIVDVVAYNGGEEEFTRIQTAFTEAIEPEAKQRNLEALSYFRGKEQIEKALNFSLGKDVRAQDVTRYIVGPLLSHTASRQISWEFVKAHWSDFNAKLNDDQMPKLIDAVAGFNSEAERSDVSAFVNTHPLPAGRRRIAKTLEMIAVRSQFKAKQDTTLSAFLKKMVVAGASEYSDKE